MTVTLERYDSVAVLTLGGAGGNPVNTELCEELITALSDAAEAGVTGIVLTGSGRVFSAGGDIETLSAWSDWEHADRVDFLENGPQAANRAIVSSPLPVVAAVNGPAAGAGMDLALACDLRIGAPNARFITAYARLGVTPGDGGAWLLPRFVGLGRAMDLLATSREVAADEALELGLITELVAADDLVARAVEIVATLSDRPIAEIRRLVHQGWVQTFDEHLRAAADTLGIVAGSDVHRAKMQELVRRLGR